MGSCDRQTPNAIYSADGKTLERYIDRQGVSVFTVRYGTQSIAPEAFKNSRRLRVVELPESLTYIGRGAFHSCQKLQQVYLPEGLVCIDAEAFADCWALPFVSLPSALQSLGAYAFSNCHSLRRVLFGDNLKTLRSYVFNSCVSLQTLELPGWLERIERFAFKDARVKELRFSRTLKEIEPQAFRGSKVDKVGAPSALENLLVGAFCEEHNPQTTWLSACDVRPYSVSEDEREYVVSRGSKILPSESFARRVKMETAILPDGLERIGDKAFYECSQLADIRIPESVTSIDEDAFLRCVSLVQLDLPARLERLEPTATTGLRSLKRIDVPATNRFFKTVDGVLFSKDGSQLLRYPPKKRGATYTIPDGVLSIEQGAFEDCSELKKVAFSKGVQSVGYRAFAQCAKLEEVKTNAALRSIGKNAFADCSRLKSGTFYPSLTYVGPNAFLGCERLTICVFSERTKVAIAASCGSRTVPRIVVESHAVEGETLARVFPEQLGESFAVSERVRSIGPRAFENCTSLRRVLFSRGVEQIGEGAFLNCSNLREIVLNEGLKSVGDDAFSGCKALESIEIPNGVTELGSSVFFSCESLRRVKLPESLTSVGKEVFMWCSALETIELPPRLELTVSAGLGSGLFMPRLIFTPLFSEDGKTLESYQPDRPDETYDVPESVEVIDDGAFRNCSRLKSISLPGRLKKIGRNVFQRCSGELRLTVKSKRVYDLLTESNPDFERSRIALAPQDERVPERERETFDEDMPLFKYFY